MSYTNPCYDNTDSASNKRIVFLCDRIAAVNGAMTENQVILKSFFSPVEESVFTSFIIPAGTSSLQLSYSNLDDPTFVFLLLSYDADLTDAEMEINWSQNETDWYPLGKMLVLTASSNTGLGAIYLKNELTTDVSVKAIVGK